MKWIIGCCLIGLGLGIIIGGTESDTWWAWYLGGAILVGGLDLFVVAKIEKSKEELIERIEALEKRIDPAPEYKDLGQIMDEMGI